MKEASALRDLTRPLRRALILLLLSRQPLTIEQLSRCCDAGARRLGRQMGVLRSAGYVVLADGKYHVADDTRRELRLYLGLEPSVPDAPHAESHAAGPRLAEGA